MKYKIHILFFALAAVTLSGCGNDNFERPDYYDTTASSKLGQKVVDGSEGYIRHVKSDSDTKLMQGVNLLRMGYLNERGQAMQLFLFKVTLGNASIQVTLPDDNPILGPVQTLSEQIAAIEGKSVYTVWGAVNGSTFTSAGMPTGILYHAGQALRDDMGSTPALFAILNDGLATCLPASEYDDMKHRIKEGVSGESHLLQNGYLLPQSDTKASARTAVGVSEDGNEVYILVVDGNDFYYSNGISRDDLAALIKGCGAHDAMTLSGDANTTALWRNERSADIFELLNKPADKGIEAEISNGIAILER